MSATAAVRLTGSRFGISWPLLERSAAATGSAPPRLTMRGLQQFHPPTNFGWRSPTAREACLCPILENARDNDSGPPAVDLSTVAVIVRWMTKSLEQIQRQIQLQSADQKVFETVLHVLLLDIIPVARNAMRYFML
jgi:hypothetical protein